MVPEFPTIRTAGSSSLDGALRLMRLLDVPEFVRVALAAGAAVLVIDGEGK